MKLCRRMTWRLATCVGTPARNAGADAGRRLRCVVPLVMERRHASVGASEATGPPWKSPRRAWDVGERCAVSGDCGRTAPWLVANAARRITHADGSEVGGVGETARPVPEPSAKRSTDLSHGLLVGSLAVSAGLWAWWWPTRTHDGSPTHISRPHCARSRPQPRLFHALRAWDLLAAHGCVSAHWWPVSSGRTSRGTRVPRARCRRRVGGRTSLRATPGTRCRLDGSSLERRALPRRLWLAPLPRADLVVIGARQPKAVVRCRSPGGRVVHGAARFHRGGRGACRGAAQ